MAEFISLFAGAGGFDLGQERSGWTCLYGVDSDHEAVETLKRNQGQRFAEDALFVMPHRTTTPKLGASQ